MAHGHSEQWKDRQFPIQLHKTNLIDNGGTSTVEVGWRQHFPGSEWNLPFSESQHKIHR